jgi:hypothetical protein
MLEQNYINILDNFLDSLIIKNQEEEEKKSRIISNFIKILYDNYMKFIDNQMIEMDDFLLKIVQSFLPNNYREEIYVKDKKNIAIIFHTIITNISEYMVEFIKLNLNLIIHNRIKENIVVIKKDFIFIFCKVKENLEINFNKEEDEDINNENTTSEIDCDEMVRNNTIYIELSTKYDALLNENKKYKLLIKELMGKNNKLTSDIIKMKKLLFILNKKIKDYNNNMSKDTDINNYLNNTNPKDTNINNYLNNTNENDTKDINDNISSANNKIDDNDNNNFCLENINVEENDVQDNPFADLVNINANTI